MAAPPSPPPPSEGGDSVVELFNSVVNTGDLKKYLEPKKILRTTTIQIDSMSVSLILSPVLDHINWQHVL